MNRKNTYIHYSIYVLIGILYCNIMFSQNLVPNPGFDEFSDCPQNSSNIYEIYPWEALYSQKVIVCIKCDGSKCVPPQNIMNGEVRYQNVRSGIGMVETTFFDYDNPENRDYTITPLKTNLEEGENYYVEFFVVPSYSQFNISYGNFVFSNAIQVAFSNTKNIKKNELFKLPIGASSQQEIVEDTSGWTRICGNYTAEGDEKYLIIGCFIPQNEVLISSYKPSIGPNYSDYFVEDVAVYKIKDEVTKEYYLCESRDSVKLNTTYKNLEHQWSNGDTTYSTTVRDTGIYYVNINEGRCIIKDTFYVKRLEEESIEYYGIVKCENDTSILKSDLLGEYLWSTGDTTRSVKINKTGTFKLEVQTRCGVFERIFDIEYQECDCNVYIPNAFSPNRDGVNDSFKMFVDCDGGDIELLRFEIYNRWGEKIYSSNTLERCEWNGRYRGKEVSQGVYFYSVEYIVTSNQEENKISKTGELTVIR